MIRVKADYCRISIHEFDFYFPFISLILIFSGILRTILTPASCFSVLSPSFACSTQHWQTHQYVKSKLHGWIITLTPHPPPLSLFFFPSPHSQTIPDFKCLAELLRCYPVTVRVWILGYKSSEPCRPTKRDPESPTAVCVSECVFLCWERRERNCTRGENSINVNLTQHRKNSRYKIKTPLSTPFV